MIRNRTTVLCAPAGWGKTRHAEQLAKQFKCTSIIDDWHPTFRRPYTRRPGELTQNGLHLTNAHPDAVRAALRCIPGGSDASIVARGWS